MGHPAVAITDHGVVQAFQRRKLLVRSWALKVIYGVEGYLIDDEIVARDEEPGSR